MLIKVYWNTKENDVQYILYAEKWGTLTTLIFVAGIKRLKKNNPLIA